MDSTLKDQILGYFNGNGLTGAEEHTAAIMAMVEKQVADAMEHVKTEATLLAKIALSHKMEALKGETVGRSSWQTLDIVKEHLAAVE